MAALGPFVQTFNETNGWPTFAPRITFGTVAGFFDRQNATEGSNFPWLYQYGWDSVISGIPAWAPLILVLEDGSVLDANASLDVVNDVMLAQDYKRGMVSWAYTWKGIGVKYEAFADKLNVNNGYVRLSLEAKKNMSVQVVNALDGTQAVRTHFVGSGTEDGMIFSGVKPVGVDVEAWVYAGLTGSPELDMSKAENVTGKSYIGDFPSSIAQSVNVSIKAGQTTTVVKHVGIASGDGFGSPRDVAKKAASSSMGASFDDCLAAHGKEWASILPKEAVSDYTLPWTGLLPEKPVLIEKQIASVISAFDILMNTIGVNALNLVPEARINGSGISVGGLVSESYGGQRFWDQDVWMHPQIATSYPESAKSITNLRVAQYPQAKRNIHVDKTAKSSSRNATKFDEEAALYPWTSGRDANCTATGPCFDYEYHLNGDIIRSFVLEWASSGDVDYVKNELLPIMKSLSTSYSNLLVKNGSQYVLRNLTDPDEYANHVDNGGFTMALIQNILNDTNTFSELFGGSREDLWDTQAASVARPKIGNISLEYTSMNGSISVKQADVVLNIYPLAYNDDYLLEQQRADLDYYAAKQSPNGPGMTFAIFSIDASSVSSSGCSAYTYDENSWSPYLRAPWFFFSEQLVDDPVANGGTNPAFPFLTGHGGFLQVDTFGYLGLRRTVDYNLRIDPSLPPQIEHLAYPVIYHQGWPIRAVSNTTHTTLTRTGTPLATANQTFSSGPITVITGREVRPGSIQTLSLAPNATITVPNNMYAHQLAKAGNLLQCRPVSSPDDNSPGLFPAGAIDGATSTSWQPATPDNASLTVDTSTVPFQKLTSVYFEWGYQPPEHASLTFHNYSDLSTGATVDIGSIEVNVPYDEVGAAVVRPVQTNSTTFEFKGEVWSANYITLVVGGNQNNGSRGAPGGTVSEFVLFGDGSGVM